MWPTTVACVDIAARIASGDGGFVLFALTPPRKSTPADRLPEIARATVERLEHLDLDGLILYDIDDESSRTRRSGRSRSAPRSIRPSTEPTTCSSGGRR